LNAAVFHARPEFAMQKHLGTASQNVLLPPLVDVFKLARLSVNLEFHSEQAWFGNFPDHADTTIECWLRLIKDVREHFPYPASEDLERYAQGAYYDWRSIYEGSSYAELRQTTCRKLGLISEKPIGQPFCGLEDPRDVFGEAWEHTCLEFLKPARQVVDGFREKLRAALDERSRLVWDLGECLERGLCARGVFRYMGNCGRVLALRKAGGEQLSRVLQSQLDVEAGYARGTEPCVKTFYCPSSQDEAKDLGISPIVWRIDQELRENGQRYREKLEAIMKDMSMAEEQHLQDVYKILRSEYNLPEDQSPGTSFQPGVIRPNRMWPLVVLATWVKLHEPESPPRVLVDCVMGGGPIPVQEIVEEVAGAAKRYFHRLSESRRVEDRLQFERPWLILDRTAYELKGKKWRYAILVMGIVSEKGNWITAKEIVEKYKDEFETCGLTVAAPDLSKNYEQHLPGKICALFEAVPGRGFRLKPGVSE
jgi:hypothetical protein